MSLTRTADGQRRQGRNGGDGRIAVVVELDALSHSTALEPHSTAQAASGVTAAMAVTGA
jgi:hypothetical protein